MRETASALSYAAFIRGPLVPGWLLRFAKVDRAAPGASQ
jgi:hypothetical protein